MSGRRTHVVALAEFDAIVTQNRIGGGDVEKEVRQRKADKVILAFELARLPAEDLGDASLQLLDRGFIVLEFRRLLAREPRYRALGEIRGDLNLFHQRKHIR